MSDRIPLPELSDEQVALANQGIEQFGAFVRDAVRQPEIVNEIPSGSTLAFYTLTLPDDWQPVRLTAFRPRRSKRWGIRVTGIGSVEEAPASPRAMPDWLVSIAPAHAKRELGKLRRGLRCDQRSAAARSRPTHIGRVI